MTTETSENSKKSNGNCTFHSKTLIAQFFTISYHIMASPIQTALKAQKLALRKSVAATLNALSSSTVDEQCVYFVPFTVTATKKNKFYNMY